MSPIGSLLIFQDEDMKQQVEKLLQAPPPAFASPSTKRPLEEEEETRMLGKTPKLINGFKEELLLGTG